jgi:lipopolysaccharide export system permease protein
VERTPVTFDRYIFGACLRAFVMVMLSITPIIWVVYALGQFNLVTEKGQSLFDFFIVTLWFLPILLLVIIPLAFAVALANVLLKLASESELVVISAAGISPWRLLRPLLMATACVVAMVGFLSAYLTPKAIRELQYNMSLVANALIETVIQPGRFVTSSGNLTFHAQGRLPDGRLTGVFIDDRREPTQHSTILAQYGDLVTAKDSLSKVLVLTDGTLQTQRVDGRDPPIITHFARYDIDTSQFIDQLPAVRQGVREKYFWELAFPQPDDTLFKTRPESVQAEFHDRITATLYPVVFLLITFAALGAPRTTRADHWAAFAIALSSMFTLRVLGFATEQLRMHWLMYLVMAGYCAFCLWIIARARASGLAHVVQAFVQSRKLVQAFALFRLFRFRPFGGKA